MKKWEEPQIEIRERVTKNSAAKKTVPLFIFVISICLAMVLGGLSVLGVLRAGKLGATLLKLRDVDMLANENFLGEMDYNDIDNMVITGYMKGLDDKYSFYEDTSGAEAVNDSFKGNTKGIGVNVFYKPEEYCYQVYRINSGSPAEGAGIKIGDKIVSIDGKSLKELGGADSIDYLRKAVGETSKVGILRNEESLEITVTHKEFVKQSVYYSIIDGYAFVAFTDFNEATVNQFEDCLSYLTEQKVKGYIFDLRDNGGGTVDSVCAILDMLVGECDLITVVYKDGEKVTLFDSDEKKVDLPMTVLINEGTASAAELFTATIQSENGGKLIGNNTYGKGVMQRTYTLSDGSMVRMTVAEFFPASGKGFNEVGLRPDYEVEFTKEQAENRFMLGESDLYTLKALEVLKGE